MRARARGGQLIVRLLLEQRPRTRLRSTLRSILPFGLRGSGPGAHVDRAPAPCRPAGARGTRASSAPASSAAPRRRRRDDDDRLAERRVRDAERGALRRPAACAYSDFLDLGRADAVARGLDHLVAPADEVEEAFLVHAHGVAREHGDLGQHQPGLAARAAGLDSARRSSPDRSSSPCRPARRGAPARRARRARTACRPRAAPGSRRSGSPCRSSRGGDRPPPAAGRSSGTPRSGRTSGTACARGSCARSASSVSQRHAAAGVGEVAQVVGRSPSGQSSCDSWIHSGGTAVRPVTRSLDERVEHVARQQVVEQHDARAGMEGRRELAEAGVERQRQRREERVVGMVLEVAARRSSRPPPCCDATARRPSACRCCPRCRGSPPCRCRSTRWPCWAVAAASVRPHRMAHDRAPSARQRVAGDTTTCAGPGNPRAPVASSAAVRGEVTSTRTLQSRRM